MIRKSMSSSANNSVWAVAGDTSRLAPSGKLARGGPGTRTETGAVLFLRRAEGSHHHRLLLKGFLCWVGRARDAGTKTPSPSFTAGSDQQGDEPHSRGSGFGAREMWRAKRRWGESPARHCHGKPRRRRHCPSVILLSCRTTRTTQQWFRLGKTFKTIKSNHKDEVVSLW